MIPIRSKISSPFADNLALLLKQHGLSLRNVAKEIGVSAAVLHAWTRGGAPQDLQAVLKLSQLLGVNFQWLLTGDSNEKKHEPRPLSYIPKVVSVSTSTNPDTTDRFIHIIVRVEPQFKKQEEE